MTLGEKLRQARLEAGLSQRQLCGEEVTRNMLSQIENGSANPSMATLSYFAARLGKSVSFFLEEEAVSSPNQEIMTGAREAFLEEDGGRILEILEKYRTPDPVFDLEAALLRRLGTLLAAKTAMEKGQSARAAQLLEEESWAGGYCAEGLERQRLLMLMQARPRQMGRICQKLPPLDGVLLLRAQAALEDGDHRRCLRLLEAVQDQDAPLWNFLRGQLHMKARSYAAAAQCLRRAEAEFPEKCVPLLEICYRELGDFRQAYYYACRARE
jgi:transcriptional regulator with XRE-family HTH domain